VLRIDEARLGWKKKALMEELYSRGIQTWHANFEPINSLTFFREDKWIDWVHKGNIERISANYHNAFPVVEKVFQTQGMGLGKMNFLSTGNLRYLRKQIGALVAQKAL
jgi:dTDP-4-amino-4,6-dideoxygalactose transaminase